MVGGAVRPSYHLPFQGSDRGGGYTDFSYGKL